MSTGRRAVVTLATAALAVPLASFAQQTAKVYRIGFLSSEAPSDASEVARFEALRSGLRELGNVEGKSIVIEGRWAEGKYDRLPALAAELVRLKVDAIVVSGTKSLLAAKSATASIPIVMGSSGDAVRLGVTTNLARPSANVTGWTFFGKEVGTKLVELLKEAVPRIANAAYLANPADSNYAFEDMERAAGSLKFRLSLFEVRAPADFERAFARMTASHCDGLFVQGDTMFAVNIRTIARLALAHRLPSASALNDFAQAGGLITYGSDRLEGYRRAAVFVDKLLKGAKPADLPIEQASNFELTINTGTAKALGLALPQPLLARARLI